MRRASNLDEVSELRFASRLAARKIAPMICGPATITTASGRTLSQSTLLPPFGLIILSWRIPPRMSFARSGPVAKIVCANCVYELDVCLALRMGMASGSIERVFLMRNVEGSFLPRRLDRSGSPGVRRSHQGSWRPTGVKPVLTQHAQTAHTLMADERTRWAISAD